MCAATTDRTQNAVPATRDAGDDGPITDADVAGVLRPFVRATRPLLGALSDADPFGLQDHPAGGDEAPGVDRTVRERVVDRLASTRAPGTAAWAKMDMHARSTWWVRRVGRLTSFVAAIPGFGGAITSRLPVTSALGAAAQGLVLCAIADEHDMKDEADVVALLGAVMFRRDLCPPAKADLSRDSDAAVDARAAELTGDLQSEKKPTLQRLGGAVWRLGRALLAVEGELGKRPRGGRISRWMSLVPVVGVAGKYLGEWSGLKKAANSGEEWIHARRGGCR
jgi:hypothetical protein